MKRELWAEWEVWTAKMLYRVQDVVGTLVETTNLLNSIEEVHAALNLGETREFFEVRTNRFNIKQDVDLDNQEDRENFEEASSMVEKLFECVKSTVQDKWSMSRDWGYEEEDRAKQVGLNRPTEDRKQVGLNRPTSAHGKQLELGLDGSINQVQHELGLDGSSVQTSARKLKQRKLRRDGQLYSFLYEVRNTVRTQDLSWTWDVWVSKILEVADRSIDHLTHSIREQCRIVSSLDLEHETGINLENECRESKDKIENIIKELSKDKATKGQLTDTARQTAYVNSLEDAARFQQRIMMMVIRQTSRLKTEEEVTESLQEQKTIQFIHLNIAKMIKDNSNEEDTNRLYSEVCKLAMGQWKLQMKVFREMNEERGHYVNGKERGPNHGNTESQEQSQMLMVNSTDSLKQDQGVDQSCIMVPGTCTKCQSAIMGPPNDRGGDNTKTWYKYCNGCHTSVRRAGKLKSETRDSQSVGDVNEDWDGEGPKGGLKGTSGQGEYVGLTMSNEAGDYSGKKWKSVFYGPGGTAIPGTTGGNPTETWFKLCEECNVSQRCKTSGSHNTRRPQSEVTSDCHPGEQLPNDLTLPTAHVIFDDHQEREMILDVLRSLREEQVVTYNAIKLTSESVRTLTEQHVKTSSMINTLLIKLIENGAHGDKTKEGTVNDHTQLAVKPHGTSKERDGEVFGMINPDCKVW